MPKTLLALFVILISFSCFNVYANASASAKTNIERIENSHLRDSLILPYAFSTDDLGAVIGVGVMATGLYQKQMSVGATAFGGDSKGIAFGVWDYQLFNSERLFFSSVGMIGKYPLLRAYTPLPHEFTPADESRSGSNDSSFDDFIEAKGSNNWWEVKLEYVLPWGDAADSAMKTYHLAGGLVEKPIKEIAPWNPLKNGTSVLIARQFNRYQLYQTDDGDLDGAVHAIELGYLYDNTDFPTNPSQGSAQYFAYTYNPKWLESNNDWSFIEFEASQYFSFGATDFAKQNILALNFWTGYSPSWQLLYDENGNSEVINNAPSLEGASLGGMYRMRGFRQSRFHDKAAIYASAEYRMTLDYNPIADVKWLKFLNLDWFQTVLFVEGGRVSPTYTKNELLTDWKSDVGFSIRALTAGIVVRFDIAKSNEGTNMWLMVGHPF